MQFIIPDTCHSLLAVHGEGASLHCRPSLGLDTLAMVRSCCSLSAPHPMKLEARPGKFAAIGTANFILASQ